jgi:hypothetical protein
MYRLMSKKKKNILDRQIEHRSLPTIKLLRFHFYLIIYYLLFFIILVAPFRHESFPESNADLIFPYLSYFMVFSEFHYLFYDDLSLSFMFYDLLRAKPYFY